MNLIFCFDLSLILIYLTGDRNIPMILFLLQNEFGNMLRIIILFAIVVFIYVRVLLLC
jgi:hypothetical protein